MSLKVGSHVLKSDGEMFTNAESLYQFGCHRNWIHWSSINVLWAAKSDLARKYILKLLFGNCRSCNYKDTSRFSTSL